VIRHVVEASPMNRWAVGILCALLLWSAGAGATSDVDKERARTLFTDGNALIDKGKYVDALEKFRAAYALWPNAKILLNIGTTLRALGRNAEAADAYEKYIAAPDADPKKRDEAKSILDTLEKSIGKLLIEPRSRLRILVDGKLVAETDSALTIRVEPGVHVVLGDREGAAPVTQSIAVAAGETRSVEIKLVETTSKEPTPTKEPPPAPVVDAPPRPLVPETVEPRRLGVFARTDIDASFRGAVAAVGASYRLDRVELAAAALLGARKGGEPSAVVFLFDRAVRPVLLVAVPFFVVDGLRVGARGGVGLHIDANASTTLFAHASVAHFFAAPTHYTSTYGLFTAGAQLRF